MLNFNLYASGSMPFFLSVLLDDLHLDEYKMSGTVCGVPINDTTANNIVGFLSFRPGDDRVSPVVASNGCDPRMADCVRSLSEFYETQLVEKMYDVSAKCGNKIGVFACIRVFVGEIKNGR